jgi:hypothetical protein
MQSINICGMAHCTVNSSGFESYLRYGMKSTPKMFWHKCPTHQETLAKQQPIFIIAVRREKSSGWRMDTRKSHVTTESTWRHCSLCSFSCSSSDLGKAWAVLNSSGSHRTGQLRGRGVSAIITDQLDHRAFPQPFLTHSATYIPTST